MNTRRHPDRTRAGSWRRCLRPLLGAFLLLLLLGWGSAAPARATTQNISGPFVEVFAEPGDVVNIYDGASSSAYEAVYVEGGTVNIYGGSITAYGGYGVALHSGVVNIYGGSIYGGSAAVLVTGGTASISGGSLSGSTGVQAEGGTTSISAGTVSGNNYGIWVNGGTVTFSGGSIPSAWKGVLVSSGTATISGGSITGSGDALNANGGTTTITGGSISTPFGVYGNGGAVSIYGCDLALSDYGQLTGTLEDGTLIDTPTLGISAGNLFSAGTCGPPPCSPGTPQIICPSNVVAGAAAGTCSATLDPGTATASDNCTPSLPVSGVRSDGQALTAPYPVGTTTVTWTAVNDAGSNSCSQTITINDSEKPTISVPAPVTVPAGPGQCTASVLSLGTPTTSDNCGVASVTNDAPSSFPIGSTTVTWTVIDIHGNQATATQTVTAVDQQPPAITCPGNQSVQTTGTGAVVNFTVSATDNCPGVSVTAVPASGSTFPVGATTVNCTATDAHGNTSTCSFTVTVTRIGADVAVSQTASPSPVVSGSQLTYTITVANNGPQAAQGVVLTDPLPSGTAFVSASRSDNAGTLTTPKGNGSTVSWSIGTLTSGQSVTLAVVVKVSAKAGTTVTNTASVTSSSPTDSSTANNNATASTPVAAKR